jgi:hypothetical protein
LANCFLQQLVNSLGFTKNEHCHALCSLNTTLQKAVNYTSHSLNFKQVSLHCYHYC